MSTKNIYLSWMRIKFLNWIRILETNFYTSEVNWLWDVNNWSRLSHRRYSTHTFQTTESRYSLFQHLPSIQLSRNRGVTVQLGRDRLTKTQTKWGESRSWESLRNRLNFSENSTRETLNLAGLLFVFWQEKH